MNWIEQFRESSSETKWLIFNWVFYGILTIATLIYCYARLDFVRSGPQTSQVQVMELK